MKGILIVLIALTTSQAWAAPAPVKVDDGDTIVAKTDVTSSTSSNILVASSNSARAALNCYTTTEIRWGDSGISATKGGLIPATGNFVIRNTGAVYVRATSSAGTVSCTEETYSAASGGPIFSP